LASPRCVITFVAALLTAFPTAADQESIPLGTLIDRSESIVIGDVSAVAGDVMTITVEEILHGPDVRSVQMRGNWNVGARLLAFAGRDYGVIIQLDERVGVQTRHIVSKAIARRANLRLSDVIADLKVSVNPALISSLLEQLNVQLSVDDASLLTEIACDSDGAFIMQARLWAIDRAGTLRLAGARSCLEGWVRQEKNVDFRIAAAEALGDLGDRASVPVLLPLLKHLPPAPTRGGNDTPPRRGVGPVDDPEDDSKPIADPEEDITPGRPSPPEDEPVMEPAERDGETEPDGASGDDEFSRRSDGGLTLTVILALGKIGDPSAIDDLFRVVREGDDLALHSTVVHALGLIGGLPAQEPLRTISESDPDNLVRALARQTLARLQEKK
jgi:hypothetical protein